MTVAIHTDPVPLRFDADGTLRVADTRVTLDVVVAQYREGASAEMIAERFDVLTAADVHAVIAYYLRHQPELDHHFAQRDRESEALLQSLGARHQPLAAVRDRLLDRVSGENSRGDQVSGG